MKIKLREIKARKAKFGFNYGSLSLYQVRELAEFMNAIEEQFKPDQYDFEEAGGYNGKGDVKVYTDDEEVAKWIRANVNLT
jgi:hypothetical protein